MYSLTETQAKLYRFIEHAIKNGSPAPSVREMAEHMGYVTTSRVHRLLTDIEERGHIKRLPRRARAIKLVSK